MAASPVAAQQAVLAPEAAAGAARASVLLPIFFIFCFSFSTKQGEFFFESSFA